MPHTLEPRRGPALLLGFAVLAALVLAAALIAGAGPAPAEEPAGAPYVPAFTADGKLKQPERHVWRAWPTLGTPLTPNALNDGAAPFPEFHLVHIDPVSWAHWQRTGEFREGTVIAKELVSVFTDESVNPDSSTTQVSGRGFFMGDYIGFEIAIKSKALFPDQPGNWAYFSFGHHPEPYAAATAMQAVETCNACHSASAAEDFVFSQFYPVLRAARSGQ